VHQWHNVVDMRCSRKNCARPTSRSRRSHGTFSATGAPRAEALSLLKAQAEDEHPACDRSGSRASSHRQDVPRV